MGAVHISTARCTAHARLHLGLAPREARNHASGSRSRGSPALTRSAPPVRTRDRFADLDASWFSTPTGLAKLGLQLSRYTGDTELSTIRAATTATAESATAMAPRMTDATEVTATTMPGVILEHVAAV